jgi:hypothetical protein
MRAPTASLSKQGGGQREGAGVGLGTWERRRGRGLDEQRVGLEVFCSVWWRGCRREI